MRIAARMIYRFETVITYDASGLFVCTCRMYDGDTSPACSYWRDTVGPLFLAEAGSVFLAYPKSASDSIVSLGNCKGIGGGAEDAQKKDAEDSFRDL